MFKKLWVIVIPLIILTFGCKVNREVSVFDVIPVLISPGNGSVVSENPPTFTWQGVDRIGYYEILILPEDNSNESETYYLIDVNSDYGATTVSYTCDFVLPSGVYTWMVRCLVGVNT